MDQQSIRELIELVDNSNIGELKIEQGNFKLSIRQKDYHPKAVTQQVVAAAPAALQAQPATESAPNVVEAPATVATPEEKTADTVAENNDSAAYETIKSPMIGTFYRSSSPEKEPFVKVGDKVEKGDVLCIIEAMKLFNEIESEFSGTVVKVLVDNAQAVEYDQPLLVIDPS